MRREKAISPAIAYTPVDELIEEVATYGDTG